MVENLQRRKLRHCRSCDNKKSKRRQTNCKTQKKYSWILSNIVSLNFFATFKCQFFTPINLILMQHTKFRKICRKSKRKWKSPKDRISSHLSLKPRKTKSSWTSSQLLKNSKSLALSRLWRFFSPSMRRAEEWAWSKSWKASKRFKEVSRRMMAMRIMKMKKMKMMRKIWTSIKLSHTTQKLSTKTKMKKSMRSNTVKKMTTKLMTKTMMMKNLVVICKKEAHNFVWMKKLLIRQTTRFKTRCTGKVCRNTF